MLPFQEKPEGLPEIIRHVTVLDLSTAVSPGAMCERTRTFSDGAPMFINVDTDEGRLGTHEPPLEPVRDTAMLHVWLSGQGDVGPGAGWTREERWKEFWGLAQPYLEFRHDAQRITIDGGRVDAGSDLFAEAIRTLFAPYHISAGITADGKPYVVKAHSPNLYTHHGGAANRDAVGIGFAWGRDLPCNPDEGWLDTAAPQVVEHVTARRDAITAALYIAERDYGIVRHVAHAASSRMRCPNSDGSGGDPGTNVMWAVGWATQALGLKMRIDPHRVWEGRGGRPLHEVWHEAYRHGIASARALAPEPEDFDDDRDEMRETLRAIHTSSPKALADLIAFGASLLGGGAA